MKYHQNSAILNTSLILISYPGTGAHQVLEAIVRDIIFLAGGLLTSGIGVRPFLALLLFSLCPAAAAIDEDDLLAPVYTYISKFPNTMRKIWGIYIFYRSCSYLGQLRSGNFLGGRHP